MKYIVELEPGLYLKYGPIRRFSLTTKPEKANRYDSESEAHFELEQSREQWAIERKKTDRSVVYANAKIIHELDGIRAFGEQPKRIGEIVVSLEISGRLVGKWKTIDIPIGDSVLIYPARIDRIQPDDGDGPGFTEFGIYNAFPVGTRVVAPWWN
jgi:hypothetical protein